MMRFRKSKNPFKKTVDLGHSDEYSDSLPAGRNPPGLTSSRLLHVFTQVKCIHHVLPLVTGRLARTGLWIFGLRLSAATREDEIFARRNRLVPASMCPLSSAKVAAAKSLPLASLFFLSNSWGSSFLQVVPTFSSFLQFSPACPNFPQLSSACPNLPKLSPAFPQLSPAPPRPPVRGPRLAPQGHTS